MLGDKATQARLGAYLMSAFLSACALSPLGNAPTYDRAAVEAPEPAPDARTAAPTVAARTAPEIESTTSVAPDLWRLIGKELETRRAIAHSIDLPLGHFHNSTKFVNQAAANAGPFLFHIHEALSRHKLPVEILLVPIIESAYNPAATSPGGAAGLWQFIPATGKRFGLHQSRWYDGRRDVVASTAAAIRYFELLRDRFDGDWALVFAAYNAGERTVENAIARNRRLGRPTDFWSLNLPRGTRAFVPKILALAEIVAHPATYGVTLARIPATPHFTSVDVGSGLDLNRVIAWSGMVGAEFARLNAAFHKRFTVDGAPTTVLVPYGRRAAVESKLAGLPTSARQRIAPETLARSGAQTPVHVVTAGDNLWVLARRYGTSVKALAAANGIAHNATLRLGQRLHVPGSSAASTVAATASTAASTPTHYEVRHGDSLWIIARRFKIPLTDLKRWNELPEGRSLQPGQRLVVAQDG